MVVMLSIYVLFLVVDNFLEGFMCKVCLRIAQSREDCGAEALNQMVKKWYEKCYDAVYIVIMYYIVLES